MTHPRLTADSQQPWIYKIPSQENRTIQMSYTPQYDSEMALMYISLCRKEVLSWSHFRFIRWKYCTEIFDGALRRIGRWGNTFWQCLLQSHATRLQCQHVNSIIGMTNNPNRQRMQSDAAIESGWLWPRATLGIYMYYQISYQNEIFLDNEVLAYVPLKVRVWAARLPNG